MGFLSVDKVQLEVQIGNDKARNSMKELEIESRNLKKSMRKLEVGSDEWLKKMERLKQVKYDYDKLRKSIDFTSLSMADLRKWQRQLTAEKNPMDPSTASYKKLEKQLAKVNGRMAELRKGARDTRTSMQRMGDSFNKFRTIGASIMMAVAGITMAIKEFINTMGGLSDQIADVMKTTGLSQKEVKGMYDEFKNLNTRTPRKELLLLAQEAGRLGKKGTKDIMEFVRVGNKIQTALGDDLGDDAAESIKLIGKLVDIYKVSEKHNVSFGFSMEMIGSAINAVSANSNAQAPYIINMMKRLGGISSQANISASDVVGLSATLDNLGQTAEMSSTAIGKTILNMFTDTADYAEIAGLSVDEFSDLLKKDSNEAFVVFLEGLNGNNEGLSAMATKLDGLGIDGARMVQVLASLSGNTQKLREQQSFANIEMIKATSLTDEYNIKNDNLAGNLSLIGERLTSIFINSKLLSGVEKIVGMFASWAKVSIAAKLENDKKSITDLNTKVNLLTIELSNSNTEYDRRKIILNELNTIAPEVAKNLNAENVNLITLTQNLTKYNAAMVVKLAMTDDDAALEQKKIDYSAAMRERLKQEHSMRATLTSWHKYLLARNKDYAEGALNIMNADLPLTEKFSKVKSMVDEIAGSNIRTQRYINTITDLNELVITEKDLQTDYNNSLVDYKNIYHELLGLNKPIVFNNNYDDTIAKMKELEELYKKPPVDPNKGKKKPKTPEELKAEYDIAIALEDSKLQQIALLNITALAEQRITEDEHHALMLNDEMMYLQKKIDLQSIAGVDSTATEIDLQKKVLSWQGYFANILEHKNKLVIEQSELYDAEMEELTDRLDFEEDAEYQKDKNITDNHLTELERRKKNNQLYLQTSLGVFDSISKFQQAAMNRQLKAAGDDATKREQIEVEFAKKQQKIAVAQAVIRGGLAVMRIAADVPKVDFGIMTAILIAAQVAATTAEVALISSQGFYDGGYTGDGSATDVAGVVHNKEYVINHTMMQNPYVANQVGILEAIRTGKTPTNQVTNNTTTTQQIYTDPTMISLLQSISNQLANQKPAIFEYKQFEDLQTEIDYIRSSVSPNN